MKTRVTYLIFSLFLIIVLISSLINKDWSLTAFSCVVLTLGSIIFYLKEQINSKDYYINSYKEISNTQDEIIKTLKDKIKNIEEIRKLNENYIEKQYSIIHKLTGLINEDKNKNN